jgi:hypothetical protein
MVEKYIKEDFQSIFGTKVSFKTEGEYLEQDCLFVNIFSAKNKIKEGRFISQVVGSASITAPSYQLPVGFLAKRIDQAPHAIKKNYFFYDIEEVSKGLQDIVTRSFSFIYFFDSQFNLPIGNIEHVNIEVS